MDAPTKTTLTRVLHCPKCGSVRVHRSRRRGAIEYVLAACGADVRRCHDCRARQAWFGGLPIRLSSASSDQPRLGLAIYFAGFIACVAILWLMITRYTGLSG